MTSSHNCVWIRRRGTAFRMRGLTDLWKMRNGRIVDSVCATSTAVVGQDREENDQVEAF